MKHIFRIEREQWIKETGTIEIEAETEEEALLLYKQSPEDFEHNWNEDLLQSEFGDIVVIENQIVRETNIDVMSVIKNGK